MDGRKARDHSMGVFHGQGIGGSYVRPLLNRALLLFVGSAALLQGCAKERSPEARIRAVIETAEQAAEARDSSDVLALMSPQFREAGGLDRNGVGQYLRAYFLAHPSIHLLTRVESIEFPAPDLGRARVTVGLVGRESGATLDLATEVHRFDLQFELQEGDWRLTYGKLL
jgi:hypothetical protein